MAWTFISEELAENGLESQRKVVYPNIAVNAYQSQTHPFPQSLDAVPPDGQLAETFAFTPGALASGAILGLIGFAIGLGMRGGPKSIEDIYLPLGCAGGAVIFGLWEVMRRLKRTVIVHYVNQIGIYRGGQLTDVGQRGQIAIYQLSVLNTVRELMAFGILALFAITGGAFTVMRDPSSGLVFLGAGIGLGGAFFSSIYARIACRHFFVPKGNGSEQVMFTRAECNRFGL